MTEADSALVAGRGRDGPAGRPRLTPPPAPARASAGSPPPSAGSPSSAPPRRWRWPPRARCPATCCTRSSAASRTPRPASASATGTRAPTLLGQRERPARRGQRAERSDRADDAAAIADTLDAFTDAGHRGLRPAARGLRRRAATRPRSPSCATSPPTSLDQLTALESQVPDAGPATSWSRPRSCSPRSTPQPSGPARSAPAPAITEIPRILRAGLGRFTVPDPSGAAPRTPGGAAPARGSPARRDGPPRHAGRPARTPDSCRPAASSRRHPAPTPGGGRQAQPQQHGARQPDRQASADPELDDLSGGPTRRRPCRRPASPTLGGVGDADVTGRSATSSAG